MRALRFVVVTLFIACQLSFASSFFTMDLTSQRTLDMGTLWGNSLLTGNQNFTINGKSVPFAFGTQGSYVWNGADDPQLSLTPNLYGVVRAYLTINTLWGQPAPPTLGDVQFSGTGGANQTKALAGNTDIRDYNAASGYTTTINGTTTQNLYQATYGSLVINQDVVIIDLNPSFYNQTLTQLLVNDYGGTGVQRLLVSAVTLEVHSPEPATFGLIGAAVFGLAGFTRYRRNRAKA